MLHNNQFGQKDMSQTNVTSEQINLQNNVNISKTQQRQTLNCNIPEYPYGSNMTAGLSQFTNVHQMGLPQQFMSQNLLRWENCVSPMNLNVQNCPYDMPFDKRSLHKETTLLNVPKFKQTDGTFPQLNSLAYTDSQLDDNSSKLPSTCGFDQYLDKNIDLTKKLEQPQETTVENASSDSQNQNDILKNYLERNKDINSKPHNDDISSSMTNDHSINNDSEFPHKVNIKNEFIKSYKDADTRKKSLEKTLRMLEISIINSTNLRNIKTEDLSNSDDCNDKQLMIDESNCMNEGLSQVKKEITESKSIEIKIELPITHCEHEHVFQMDYFGVQKDMVTDVYDAECAQTIAYEFIRNGTHPESYFECPDCNLCFSHPKRFLIHVKWHSFGLTNEKRLEIQKDKEMKRQMKKDARSEKKQNKVVKKETDGHVCKLCNKSFSTYGRLKNHRQKLHPSRARDCKICGIRVLGWVAMKAHMTSHPSPDAGFNCPDCPKRFKHAHSLAKHRDTHKEKTQACPQCPKKFGSTTLLNIHMKTHERMQRGATFRCTYCGKGYFESFSLAAHERTHRNEKPFQCEICNTCFGTNSSLKRHLKVSHSTQKPYVCSTCHRSFVTEAIRNRHELRFHGNPDDFKHPCALCPSKYFELKDLKKHVYKVHSKAKRKNTDSELSDE